jgi:hypothetical protein
MTHLFSKKFLWILFLGLFAIGMVACGGGAEEEPETATEPETSGAEVQEPVEEPAEEPEESASSITELTILWAQWDPADYLQEIGNMYQEETGITVNVVQEPWGSFGDLFFTEMAAQGTSYDMVVFEVVVSLRFTHPHSGQQLVVGGPIVALFGKHPRGHLQERTAPLGWKSKKSVECHASLYCGTYIGTSLRICADEKALVGPFPTPPLTTCRVARRESDK